MKRPPPPGLTEAFVRRTRALDRRIWATALITSLLAVACLGLILSAGPGRADPTGLDLTRTDATPLWGGLALGSWAIAALLCLVRPCRPLMAVTAIGLALGLSLLSGSDAAVDAPLLPGLPSQLELTARLGGPERAEAVLAAAAEGRSQGPAAADQAYLGAQLAAARGDAAAVRRLLEPWREGLDRRLYGLPTAALCCQDWRPDVLAQLETMAYGRPLSAAALDLASGPPAQVGASAGAGAPIGGFVLSLGLGLAAVAGAGLWRVMRAHRGRIRRMLRSRPRPPG